MAEPEPPKPGDAAAAAPVVAAEGEPAAPVELTEEELKAIEDEKIRAEEERIRVEAERMRLEREEKKRIEEEERKIEEERQRVEQARLQLIVEATEDEIHGLESENTELQRRVCGLQKKRRSVNAEQFILEGQDAFYKARLRKWTEAKIEFKRVKDNYDKKIDDLRDRLQEKRSESAARHEWLIHYFWSTARHSRDIVSAQRIPRRTLLGITANAELTAGDGDRLPVAFYTGNMWDGTLHTFKLEQDERDCVAEMQSVRIRGRQLKSQLAKLELKLELKDQLQLDTGNLHSVDYEQLKMENESLNAKIHLKNEALSALKKKTAQLVHCLTHVREKLQFLVVACKVDGEALANDDKTLHTSRIKTSRLKSSIMAIRRKKEALQKNFVSVSAPLMLDDMDYQREDIEFGEREFEALKKRYHDLCAEVEQKKGKLYGMEALPLPGKSSAEEFTIEHGNQRWGMRREVLGQIVVREIVQQMANQSAAKELQCTY